MPRHLEQALARMGENTPDPGAGNEGNRIESIRGFTQISREGPLNDEFGAPGSFAWVDVGNGRIQWRAVNPISEATESNDPKSVERTGPPDFWSKVDQLETRMQHMEELTRQMSQYISSLLIAVGQLQSEMASKIASPFSQNPFTERP